MGDSQGILGRVRAVTRFSATHPWIVLPLILCLIFGCWFYASHLELKTDFLQLLPSRSPAAIRFQTAADRRRGSSSTLLVVVESDDDALSRRFIDRIEPELRALPPDLVGSVEHGPGAARAFFDRYRWLFAAEKDLELASCELESARARAVPGYVELDDPCADLRAGSLVDSTDADDDDPTIAERAEHDSPLHEFEARANREIAKHDRYPTGYFRTEDGGTYTLIVRSPIGGFGGAKSERLVHEAGAICTRARNALGIPASAVGFAGEIPTALADMQALKDDLTIVSGTAILLIVLCIIVFFRSFLSLFHIGVAVLSGCGIAFATAMAVFGHLNNATAFLGSIIFGNGINYGIVYLARYRERRGLGDDLITALDDAASTCLRSTWLASLAASGAYAALMITSFRGFSEFGLIGGVGMVACWLSTFVAVPATISAFERIANRAAPQRAAPKEVRAPIASAIGRFTRVHPRIVVVTALALMAAAIVPLKRYLADPWEYDFSKLRSASSNLRGAGRWSTRSDAVFRTRGSPQLLLADSMNQVLELAAQVRRADEDVTGGQFVERVETIYDALGGTPTQVARKLELLAEIREHIDHVLPHASPDEQPIANRWRPPEYLRALRPSDLPPLVLEKFTEKDGRVGTSVFVYLSRTVSQSRGQNLLRISDLLERVRLPNGQPVPNAARATVFAEMIRSMERDAPRATLAALLVVIAVCVFFARRVKPIAAVLGSLLCAVILTVGGAAWFNVRLNFLNFVALPLTFGIGVEYAINLFDRIRAEKGDVTAGVRSIGGAVIVCALTTIFGYASLLFADSQALQSFGRYAIAGEFACITTALLVMPASLALGRRRGAAAST